MKTTDHRVHGSVYIVSPGSVESFYPVHLGLQSLEYRSGLSFH